MRSVKAVANTKLLLMPARCPSRAERITSPAGRQKAIPQIPDHVRPEDCGRRYGLLGTEQHSPAQTPGGVRGRSDQAGKRDVPEPRVLNRGYYLPPVHSPKREGKRADSYDDDEKAEEERSLSLAEGHAALRCALRAVGLGVEVDALLLHH